ncbi:hypothetical protein D9613_008958 [Agrocybe pediades]|uniref:HMG box domain-containing protein n=1 Tax=Agrocybe pediades TaxID=84607 RepID=A0A8H4QUI3_9AGAR|nr:hypothetical protein D9613_008958 [Agrocybe pediades]
MQPDCFTYDFEVVLNGPTQDTHPAQPSVSYPIQSGCADNHVVALTSPHFPSSTGPFLPYPGSHDSPAHSLADLTALSYPNVFPSPTQAARTSRRRRHPDHIPCPRNAFIFFRSYYIDVLRQSDDLQQNVVSKRAGQAWRSMSKEQRKPFEELALEERRVHKQVNPDYVYSTGGRRRASLEEPQLQSSLSGLSPLVSSMLPSSTYLPDALRLLTTSPCHTRPFFSPGVSHTCSSENVMDSAYPGILMEDSATATRESRDLSLDNLFDNLLGTATPLCPQFFSLGSQGCLRATTTGAEPFYYVSLDLGTSLEQQSSFDSYSLGYSLPHVAAEHCEDNLKQVPVFPWDLLTEMETEVTSGAGFKALLSNCDI